MTKEEIYNKIRTEPFKHLSSGLKGFLKRRTFEGIGEEFDSWEELYDFLLPDTNKICECSKCSNKKKFKSFTKGYNRFCSIRCNNIWLSESRIGKNNPSFRMSEETRKNMGRKASIKMKKLILEGKFNPCVTNSWCHSKIKIKFRRGNEIVIQNVRSSWEAFYQLLNPNLEYEKLRVPYFYNNSWHTYIVDFIDLSNNIAIEIKPDKESYKEKNRIKEKALIEWCNQNNYTYKRIGESYFSSIKWNESLISDQPDYNKLSNPKFKKYFSDEN